MANNSNLKPYKPGQSGNPAGKPKGARSWSKVVQDLLQDELLSERVFKKDFLKYRDILARRDGLSLITIAMMRKAMAGDHKAADWLRKTGYGDKLVLDTEEGLFGSGRKLEISIVDAPDTTQPDAEPSSPAPQ